MRRYNTLLCVGMLLPSMAMADELRTTDADTETVVRGNNAFAIELYSQLENQPGNLFFSPESISTALAMAYAGARGDTASEMSRALHFTLPQQQLHPAMATLLRDRNAAHEGYTLKEVDALWGQNDYPFLSVFLKLTKDNYGASFNTVDFKGQTEKARQTINNWVEQQTENQFKDLLQPGILTNGTRLLLTNAIYFKGDWDTQFEKEETKDEVFHVSVTQTVQVPMMHRTGIFICMSGVYSGMLFKALEIPYKNKDLSMIVLLPDAVNGLSTLQEALSADKIHMWLGQLRPAAGVIVTIPRFKMEEEYQLKDSLAAMGIRQAFGPGADFSGMVTKKTSQRDGSLYISAVIHKAYIEVNEEGTEAAAATAVVMVRPTTSFAAPPPPPFVFRADHPFLFLIRDNKTGSILFMGRVTDPSK